MFDRTVEILFGIGLVVNALLFLPQFVRILQRRSAEDISLSTFLGFNIFNFVTLSHGLVHFNNIFIIGAAATLVANTIVTISIIVYRFGNGTQYSDTAAYKNMKQHPTTVKKDSLYKI